jgi:hypothetical protein
MLSGGEPKLSGPGARIRRCRGEVTYNTCRELRYAGQFHKRWDLLPACRVSFAAVAPAPGDLLQDLESFWLSHRTPVFIQQPATHQSPLTVLAASGLLLVQKFSGLGQERRFNCEFVIATEVDGVDVQAEPVLHAGLGSEGEHVTAARAISVCSRSDRLVNR